MMLFFLLALLTDGNSIEEEVITFNCLRVAEIVECVSKYVDGILEKLQSLSPY